MSTGVNNSSNSIKPVLPNPDDVRNGNDIKPNMAGLNVDVMTSSEFSIVNFPSDSFSSFQTQFESLSDRDIKTLDKRSADILQKEYEKCEGKCESLINKIDGVKQGSERYIRLNLSLEHQLNMLDLLKEALTEKSKLVSEDKKVVCENAGTQGVDKNEDKSAKSEQGKINQKTVSEDHMLSVSNPYAKVQEELSRIISSEKIDVSEENKKDTASAIQKESKDPKDPALRRNTSEDKIHQLKTQINDRRERMKRCNPGDELYKYNQVKLEKLEAELFALSKTNKDKKSGDPASNENKPASPTGSRGHAQEAEFDISTSKRKLENEKLTIKELQVKLGKAFPGSDRYRALERNINARKELAGKLEAALIQFEALQTEALQTEIKTKKRPLVKMAECMKFVQGFKLDDANKMPAKPDSSIIENDFTKLPAEDTTGLESMLNEMRNNPHELKLKQGGLDVTATEEFIKDNQEGMIGYVATGWLNTINQPALAHHQVKMHGAFSENVVPGKSQGAERDSLNDLPSLAFSKIVEARVESGEITDAGAANMYHQRWHEQPNPYLRHSCKPGESNAHVVQQQIPQKPAFPGKTERDPQEDFHTQDDGLITMAFDGIIATKSDSKGVGLESMTFDQQVAAATDCFTLKDRDVAELYQRKEAFNATSEVVHEARQKREDMKASRQRPEVRRDINAVAGNIYGDYVAGPEGLPTMDLYNALPADAFNQ